MEDFSGLGPVGFLSLFWGFSHVKILVSDYLISAIIFAAWSIFSIAYLIAQVVKKLFLVLPQLDRLLFKLLLSFPNKVVSELWLFISVLIKWRKIFIGQIWSN